MSSRPGLFSLLAESQRRNQAVRRSSDRETQRRTPVAVPPIADRNGSSSHIDTDSQTRPSTPTATPSHTPDVSIDLSAIRLGSSDAWELFNSDGGLQTRGLTDATEHASALLTRVAGRRNYLDSAESVWDDLCIAREQLQILLDSAALADEALRFRATRTLANVYQQLGDNDKAQTTLESICPSLPLGRTAFGNLLAWHKIDALLDYLRFLTTTARNVEQAEKVARLLPWATPDVLRTEERRKYVLFSLTQVLNCQGRHSEAYETMGVFELLSTPTSLLDPGCHLQKAIAAAGKGLQGEAGALFADALILSSVINGPWHSQTLQILTHFGRAMKAWLKYDTALQLLVLSCKGYYYTLGISHPRSVQAYKELRTCKGAGTAIQQLRRLGHVQQSKKRKWSMAYEQSYLLAPVELLVSVVDVDIESLSRKLGQLIATEGLSREVVYNAKRSLAWCTMEQNKLTETSLTLYNLHAFINSVSNDAVGVEACRAVLASDEAICAARSADLGLAFKHQRSKLVYLALRGIEKERSHQAKAIFRRLTKYGLTHFTREVIYQDPPLIIETNRESLGSGSSATVDTVQIGTVFYARKCINLPRQSQQQHRLREDIQKEIEITHALDHPHIVRVLLTYEETKRFSIIMHPLADCDLESYLANNTCSTAREQRLIWKWMACLANTLAYIHSREIRHKDIKPRNVLVKGEKVYFTDFGSGYMFNDGGNSTTDGVAYGHTRAYCAPEVNKNENRNRSSDVFSLGCVFSEMAAWGSEISMSDYFKGIRGERNNADTVQYHSSILRIKAWFEREIRLTQRSKEVYSEVVKRMIRKNPDSRWTAVEVSHGIRKIVPSGGCIKCGIDLWVSDSASNE